MSRGPDEFTCTECGRQIVSFPARDPPPTVCMMCLFLAGTIADPVERAEVRRRLVLGSSGVQTLGVPAESKPGAEREGCGGWDVLLH